MSREVPLCIVYRPIDGVRPDPGNAKTHPKKQVSQIAASIRAFGFTNPILIDERGTVIAGHGRLRAARQIGLERVPTITLAHLTEVEAGALRLADNRIAQNSGWDTELLKTALEQLTAPEIAFDIQVIGFSVGEIDLAVSPPKPDVEDDVLPEVGAKPRARPGDIWVVGEHRIGCGDARDEHFVGQVMGQGVAADMAFLDPPYNVAISDHANVRARHREFAMASGELSADEYATYLSSALAVAIGASRDGAVHFVMIDWRHMDVLKTLSDQAYGAMLNLCVWNKSNSGMGSLYRSKHELVFVLRTGTGKHLNTIELGRHGRHRTNVWEYPSVTSPRGSRRLDLEWHPTVKPVAMVADAIKDVTRRGDVILDLFLGSGTTLIAAERTCRRCRGVEIDPGYVDIALDRWSIMTGLEPVRTSNPMEHHDDA